MEFSKHDPITSHKLEPTARIKQVVLAHNPDRPGIVAFRVVEISRVFCNESHRRERRRYGWIFLAIGTSSDAAGAIREFARFAKTLFL